MLEAATVAPFQQQIQPQQQLVNNGMSGQYVCPVHGAIGLPQYNASGAPVCPMGDQIMQFRGTGSNNLTLAAGG